MDNKYKEQLFTLWDNFGKVDFKTTKYIGRKFYTYDEYTETIEDYLDIPRGELFDYISNYITEKFKSKAICNMEIKNVSVSAPFKTDRESNMSLLYNGIGGGLELNFIYTVDPNFECPEYYDDEIEYPEQCYDDICVSRVTRPLVRDIRDTFGVRLSKISYESEERYKNHINNTEE
tara:strand:+ start:1879 stop:2406 length:528 start_codon:yes stop_codon:yes gene_type:complete